MIKFVVGKTVSDSTFESGKEDKPIQASLTLNLRKDNSGNYLIRDHYDIDIIYRPSKSTVTCYPKDQDRNDLAIYSAMDRLFNKLIVSGVVVPESVQGGAILNSLEAKVIPVVKNDISQDQVVIFTIGKFIEEERPFFTWEEKKEDEELEWIAEPDSEYSTELGEVPHAVNKGTMQRNSYPYGFLIMETVDKAFASSNVEAISNALRNELNIYPVPGFLKFCSSINKLLLDKAGALEAKSLRSKEIINTIFTLLSQSPKTFSFILKKEGLECKWAEGGQDMTVVLNDKATVKISLKNSTMTMVPS